ncbi:MAG TPA: UDP-N-acetyl-D-mannosamine dehydrogenase [Hyphomonas sp.]|nr:UDP-N-acetyl-D-mannosamine dehydrogenase [Hyphomonas sp.]
MSTDGFRKICVMGLGYIGLPTAAMFASRKLNVVGVDVNPSVVDTVNQGKVHIVEPDLDMIVNATVSQGYLRAALHPEAADAFLITVPTPFTGENHEPDLSYVEAATNAVAKVLQTGNLVVLESTSPVGTTEKMAESLAARRPDLSFPNQRGAASDIRIAHCPERVLPGRILHELVANDRVIGGMTQRCSAEAAQLYKSFVKGDCVIASKPGLAEMCKLVENSFRDVNIAFANELSLICSRLGLDVWELIQLANRHPRVNILQPGPGVGGHCIAVDPWFIVSSAPDEARLIKTARNVNDFKPEWTLGRVRAAIARHLMENPAQTARDVAVALYGLAFKADIDDLRESPALAIARSIAREHPGPVLVVEPNITQLPAGLERASHTRLAEAARADVHVMLTDHTPFRNMTVPGGEKVDTRGVWKKRPLHQ